MFELSHRLIGIYKTANATKSSYLPPTVVRRIRKPDYFINTLRNADVGSWFDENETVQVTRRMRILDPGFDWESFERELVS